MSEQIPDINNPETWINRPHCDSCKKFFSFSESWYVNLRTFEMLCLDCKKKKDGEVDLGG